VDLGALAEEVQAAAVLRADGKTMKEIHKILFKNKARTIALITSPKGFSSKIYDQNVDEWVYLIQGSAVMKLGKILKELKAGDSLFIKKHVIHQVLKTSTKQATLWLAVYTPTPSS